MYLNNCIDSENNIMEIVFEANASIMLDKLEKHQLISWSNSDINHESYRDSWCQYRNSSLENKENIEPLVNNENVFEEDGDELMGGSGEEPIEIVTSLSVCSIATGDVNSQENNSLAPPPTKRAKIVKSPEAYESEKKSTTKSKPFSFLAREEANRERRDARRRYQEILAKKMSPQPFKAKPMPKFKPLTPTSTRSTSLEAKTSVMQAIDTPKISGPMEIPLSTPTTSAKGKSNVRQSISLSRPSNSTGGLSPTLHTRRDIHIPRRQVLTETPKTSKPTRNLPSPRPDGSNVLQPISISWASKPIDSLPATPRTPRESRIPRFQITNKSADTVSQESNKSTENCTPARSSLKRGFSATKSTTTVQTPKSTEKTPQKRPITVPKSPRLSTAIRARERREFEEMMEGKLRQRDTMKRMEIATIRRYEQEEVAQLRKSTVHKPLPLPNYKNRSDITRPPSHPMLPAFVKRPRWV